MTDMERKVVVVYNHLNYDAVIAAGVIKAEMMGRDGLSFVDISQTVDPDGDTYYWVGVDPQNTHESLYIATMSQPRIIEHIVFLDSDIRAHRNEDAIKTPWWKFFSKEMVDVIEEEDDHDVPVKDSLITKVCAYFRYSDENWKRLGFHASRFHHPQTELEYLAYIYANLVSAHDALTRDGVYVHQDFIAKHIDIYLDDIKKAKQTFTSSHRRSRVLDGKVEKTAIYTTNSDFSYHLKLRLIRLSNFDFMNIITGMVGMIAYTNMRHVVYDKHQNNMHVIH